MASSQEIAKDNREFISKLMQLDPRDRPSAKMSRTYPSVIGTSLPTMTQALGPATILESGLDQQQLNGAGKELKGFTAVLSSRHRSC